MRPEPGNPQSGVDFVEHPRTFSNHIIAEIAMCVELSNMSSEWFDCTEPSLTTSLQEKQCVLGAYALVALVRCGFDMIHDIPDRC